MTPYNVMTRDLITMIAELGIPSMDIALSAAGAGLAHPTEFTTQWGENWAWDRAALAKLPTQRLVGLLEGLKETVGYQ
jgi:hypothetical protein